MFDPFTLALIGGAAGGLLNKKDPLKGALLGAAGGYGGGLLAGNTLLASQAAAPVAESALAQSAVTAAAPAATPAATMSASQFMNPQTVNLANSGLLSSGGANPAMAGMQNYAPVADAVKTPVSEFGQFAAKAKEFGGAVKPYADAAGTAASVANLMKPSPQAPIQHAQLMPSTPSPMFNNVMQNIMGKQSMDRAMEEQRKARRMQLIGGA